MTTNRCHLPFRLGAVAALAIASFAGCGGGGFDADKFADQAVKEGGMSKEDAKCFADYIDKNGSDEVKEEFQKMADDESYADSDLDPAIEKEAAELTMEAAGACQPLVTTP